MKTRIVLPILAALLLASQAVLYAAAPSPAATPAVPNFSPGPKYADNARMHQGIPSIERARNGRLWATWYGGGTGEDHHNYVMLATSADDGRTWSPLKLVLDPDRNGPARAFDPCLWHDPKGRLWLFWGQKDRVAMHNFAMTADDSTVADPVWSPPRRISAGVMLNKPTVLRNGDWLLPTCIWRDDASSRVLRSRDGGATFELLGTAGIPVKEDRNGDENMIIERNDGSLWMLVRTGYGLGHSMSTDGGKTWTPVAPSGIPHAESRFFIRRLASGRLLLVRHNAPKITQRAHLTAFLSEDDGRTWGKGLLVDERPGVSYPDAIEGPSGEIRLIYDFCRKTEKQVLMAVFNENDVLAGKFSPNARLRVLVNQATGRNPLTQPLPALHVAALASDGFRLVQDGKSGHVIHCDANASASVQEAAKEIQRVVKIMTGAELPLSREPADQMICLGDNEASRKAGVALAADAADDSFILRTVGENLFIAGKDSPDEPRPPPGWASRGTLYGAYEFLETLGARWLLPGEWGEDIPRRATLTVPRMNVRQSPAFFSRILQDVQDRRPPGDKQPSAPKLWLQRQKIPSTLDGWKLSAGHSWDDYITPQQADEHPEWLAKDSAGKPRRFARHKAIKFCTLEPALIEAFAEGVIRSLDKNPRRRCASISASDGGDFCQCAKCAPHITTDPHGKPSYSTLMVRFYDEVARRVAVKHPDRLLCGIVYYNYMYPPPQLSAKLAPNLWLSWTPLNYYGWGLAKPVYRDEFKRIAAAWRAVTPNLIHHNYSTWMRSFNGAPIPPALDILKLELPAAHSAGARAVDMVGLGAWGYGAPTNYILARQMWNPRVNVDALYREWLQRAYGPGWQAMDKLFRMLEARMMARKAEESPAYRGQNYEVNYNLLAEVHAPVFAEMERLYLDAMAKTATEAQRRRLEMFGENLIRLHHDLRQAGLLTDAEKSVFHRDDEAYRKFLADTEFSFAQYRDHKSRYLVPIWKGEYRGP